MPVNHYIGSSKFKSSKEPVKGYKRANLFMDKKTGSINIQSLQTPVDGLRLVEFNAESMCHLDWRHDGNPSKYCQCGFYSYTRLADAHTHFQGQLRKESVLLHTVSSGKVISYSKGSRAARQRVAEIILDTCFAQDCNKPADRFTLIDQDNSHLAGTCVRHAYVLQSGVYSFEKVAKMINATLKNGEPEITISMLGKGKPWNGRFDFYMSQDVYEMAAIATVATAAVVAGRKIFGALR